MRVLLCLAFLIPALCGANRGNTRDAPNEVLLAKIFEKQGQSIVVEDTKLFLEKGMEYYRFGDDFGHTEWFNDNTEIETLAAFHEFAWTFPRYENWKLFLSAVVNPALLLKKALKYPQRGGAPIVLAKRMVFTGPSDVTLFAILMRKTGAETSGSKAGMRTDQMKARCRGSLNDVADDTAHWRCNFRRTRKGPEFPYIGSTWATVLAEIIDKGDAQFEGNYW